MSEGASLYMGETGEFFHIKKEIKTSQSSKVLGLTSPTLLNKKLQSQEKELRKWKDLAERYCCENKFMRIQLRKSKKKLFFELFGVRLLVRIMSICQLKSVAIFVLFLNAFLLFFLLFVSGKHSILFDFTKNKKKDRLMHNIFFPYTIELCSFFSLNPAQKMVIELKNLGFRSYIGKVFEKDKTIYRVYVDEYKSLNAAQKTLDLLKKRHSYEKSFIRRKF